MHAKLNYILSESERTTDTQRAFFRKSQTFGLGQTNRAQHFLGIWGIFSRIISNHFGFPLFNHYFYKKLSLYIHITKYLLGFEFGPQRIRDLAFVCQ